MTAAALGLLAWVGKRTATRYKHRNAARLKHFQRQLSKLKLGGFADDLQRILGEDARGVKHDLEESNFRGKGHFWSYDLEYASLKFAIRDGRIEAFSVSAKSRDLRFSIRGEEQCQSLALGDKFGLCPDDQVFYREIVAGNKSNRYLECRPNVGEADPNIWLHGWRLQEFSGADAWWNRPQWLEVWPRKFRARHELSTLSRDQREELSSFRDSLEINVVGTMSTAEFAACGGILSAYA